MTTDGKTSYKASGVDIEAGYEAVRRIQGHASSTFRPEVLRGIGSFGSFFALDTAKYKQPVLVSGADGVGTKLKIAFMMDKHDTIGIDAVAYCVNDIVCQGAEPLFFLDYLALGKLDPTVVEAIVSGVAKGCREAGCSLVGGETAEMPGFYAEGEYDLAGFVVGVAERDAVIDGSRVQAGDAVVGIASTGLQSSGFSLVRHICFERKNLKIDTYIPEFGRTLGEELLEPTGIYVPAILSLINQFDVRGIANISGGGLPENLPRAVGEGMSIRVRKGAWETPPVFHWLQSAGNVEQAEMFKTFNMGVGMAVIVPQEDADGVVRRLAELGWKSWIIGEIQSGEKGVEFS